MNEMKTSSQSATVAESKATPKQAEETRDLWWWVERSVWTARMLSRLGSPEEAAKVWYSMMDKVYAPDNLQSAFGKVWSNQGSAGVDGQSVQQFDKHAEAELARLHDEFG
jgi:pentatricopeptide repeat protein